MTVSAEFHYDFASPNTYFCHRVIPAIEERTGVRFEYVPILLGGVFKATNNRSPMEQFAGIKNKNEYQALETSRFISKHGLTAYRRNPFFPVNTLHLMRGAVYASGQDYYAQYIETMYQAMWEQQLDMANPEVIASTLDNAGLPAGEIMQATSDPAVKQRLIDNTAASVARGTFGSPTFYIDQEIYFGKDKLGEVEDAIRAAGTD